MESNDLKIFQAVAYEKSISKAAARLGYVQSNITLRIQTLEKELGTTLLLRNNKGVTLTDSGKKLLTYAEEIIRLMDEAEKVLKSENSDNTLIIGATHTISASIVPEWLNRYSRLYPEVKLSLKTEIHSNLMEQLIRGELEGVFTNVLFKHNNIKTVRVYVEELVILTSMDIKKADNIFEFPIIVNSNKDCPYRNILEKWVTINNGNVDRIIEFDSLEGIIKCVESGMGISILPNNLVKDNNRLYKHELPSAFNQVRVYFLMQKEMVQNKPICNFIELLLHEDI